jgi:hypothetical protein
MTRLHLLLAATVWAAVLTAASAADPPVKLLTGFERDEALKWGYVEADGRLAPKNPAETVFVLARGDASQGEWAYRRHFGKDPVNWYLRSGQAAEEILYMQGVVYNTFRTFRQVFPTDWSDYALLRLDVKSTGSPVRLRLMLEDELISPHLTRDYETPEGMWVTLEFDLAEAARLREVKMPDGSMLKARLLNPARMANILLRVEKADKETDVLLDNIRLVASGASDGSRLPVLVDQRPFPVPGPLPARAAPLQAEPFAGPRRWVDVKTETPVRVDFNQGGSYGTMTLPRALAVGDSDHLLFAGSIGSIRAAQTVDGGKTWTDLAGKVKAMTACQHTYNAPGNVAAADGEDLLIVYTARCSNMSRPTDIYFRACRFDGKGWTLGPPRLVDVDVRHCPEHLVRVLRLANGRLWAVWLHQERSGGLYLRGRYSDDRGETWRTSDSNGLAMIERRRDPAPLPLGVSWWQESPAGWVAPPGGCSGRLPGRVHPHCGFDLTPYGNSVACLYGEGNETLAWTWYDATKGVWSPPAPVLKAYGGAAGAVTLGEKAIYVIPRDAPKVLRLESAGWVEDTPEGFAGRGVLSVCGTALYCFWIAESGDKRLVRSARKPAGGVWSNAVTLAEETEKLQGLTVPRRAPEGFVPLAWGPAQGWVKFLRLPVGE